MMRSWREPVAAHILFGDRYSGSQIHDGTQKHRSARARAMFGHSERIASFLLELSAKLPVLL
jgi:hypothetical protein